ncbi:MAG: hypothetical protein ACRD8O_13080 [Bryobacteraceae bacterium]
MFLLLSRARKQAFFPDFYHGLIVQPQEKGEVLVTVSPQLPRSGPDRFQIPVQTGYGVTDKWQLGGGWAGFQ